MGNTICRLPRILGVVLIVLVPTACGGDDGGPAQPDAGPPAQVVCGDGVVDGSEMCEPGPGSCCNDSCDGVLAAGTECRPVAGACDVAETCSGADATCPDDAVQAAGAVCREDAGECDLAESCDGTNAMCPDDGFVADDTACTDCAFGEGNCVCGVGACRANPGLMVINEIDSDTPDLEQNGMAYEDGFEFIELYDGGVGNSSLDGIALLLVDGSNNTVYSVRTFDGRQTDADGYFVIGAVGVSPDFVIPVANPRSIQDGPDAVVLYLGTDATTGTQASNLDQALILDAVVYSTGDANDNALINALTPGEIQVDEAGGGDEKAHSLQRVPDGTGGFRGTSAFVAAPPTPGAPNQAL